MSQKRQVAVRRGGRVESVHTVHAVVVDENGAIVARVGDVDLDVFLRSAAKPFQAVPLVEDGVVEALGLTEEELAVACASHNAEPGHLTTVRSILSKADVPEDALACGPHLPMLFEEAGRLLLAGNRPTSIHNNCSGKHAGMLALSAHHGWPLEGYQLAGHPVQDRMLREISLWTGLLESNIPTGVDGCGVLSFSIPLEALARGIARFVATPGSGDPADRIVTAMVRNPWMVAGTERLCTDLMARAEGRILAKTGAEGVYVAGIPAKGLGVALKIEDGNRRASEPALLRLLEEVGILDAEDMEALDTFARPRLTNTQDDEVGDIQATFSVDVFEDGGLPHRVQAGIEPPGSPP